MRTSHRGKDGIILEAELCKSSFASSAVGLPWNFEVQGSPAGLVEVKPQESEQPMRHL